MIKQVMVDAINEQIAKEMYSSNLYLSMAAYFHTINLNGMAHWMRLQAQEELTHALKFFDYLLDRGGQVVIKQVAQAPSKWTSPFETFEESYKHEQMITESINKLADLAIKEGDHATNILLQWFITEQVEEEATVSEIVERLRMVGQDKGGLFLIDNELKQRSLAPEPNAK